MYKLKLRIIINMILFIKRKVHRNILIPAGRIWMVKRTILIKMEIW